MRSGYIVDVLTERASTAQFHLTITCLMYRCVRCMHVLLSVVQQQAVCNDTVDCLGIDAEAVALWCRLSVADAQMAVIRNLAK